MLPFTKILCPSCFEESYLGDCRIVSGITPGKVLTDPSKTVFARMHIQPLDGPFYTKELAHRECPHCRYLLPFNIERVPNISIVIVGDNSSGKSHYIAAL